MPKNVFKQAEIIPSSTKISIDIPEIKIKQKEEVVELEENEKIDLEKYQELKQESEEFEKNFNEKQTAVQEEKLIKGKLNLEDFSEQLQQIKKMGSMASLLDMLPGNLSAKSISTEEADKKMNKTLAIIQSMTLQERRNPEILNANRRKRIASGSGSQVQDVNRVIKEFYNMQLLMKKFGKLDKKGLSGLLR